MRIESVISNINSYFIIEENSCLLVDPGFNFESINYYLKSNNLNLKGILLTHAHYDHFLCVNDLAKIYSFSIYIHEKEVPLLYDPNKNYSKLFCKSGPLMLDNNINVITIDESTSNIEGFNLKIIDIGGHSPGSICIYIKEINSLISGDVFLVRNINRPELIFGGEQMFINKINKKLFVLPEDTVVYPGHKDLYKLIEEKNIKYYNN